MNKVYEASDMMPSRCQFRVVEVTSEEDGHKAAELLEVGPQAKGWISAKYCIFPQVSVKDNYVRCNFD